jgi:hypothetical protein
MIRGSSVCFPILCLLQKTELVHKVPSTCNLWYDATTV